MSVATGDITEFLAGLPKGHPLIGLDLGTKTIGVAVSDRLLTAGNACCSTPGDADFLFTRLPDLGRRVNQSW